MAEYNLIALLKSLSKNEIKEFDKFLRSPYFMEGKNIRSKLLYEYFCLLEKHFPEFPVEELNRENLFRKIYSERKYSDVLFRRLNSDLSKLVIEFINLEEYKKNAAERNIGILSALNKRKLDKLLLKNMSAVENIIHSLKYNSNHYYYKQQICSIKNNFAYVKDDWLKMYDIPSEADNYIKYTLCRALEIYRNINNDKAILNLKYNTQFFENLLSYIKANDTIIKNDDYIAMHYYEIMLNTEKNDDYYYKLKEVKNKLISRLSEETIRNLYITLVNYCIRKTNSGFEEFREERFELDKEIMENDIHNKHEYYDMNYFLSSVRNSVSLKQSGWAEKFIEKYKDRLESHHRVFALNFAMGVLSYGKKNYGKALEYLSKINIEYSARKQQVKNLMLVIYCETGAFENALNLIDTSKRSLKNDKQIPEERKKTFRKFLTFAGMYIKLKLVPDEFKADSLKEKITNSSHFVYREWLLRKTGELNIAALQ